MQPMQACNPKQLLSQNARQVPNHQRAPTTNHQPVHPSQPEQHALLSGSFMHTSTEGFVAHLHCPCPSEHAYSTRPAQLLPCVAMAVAYDLCCPRGSCMRTCFMLLVTTHAPANPTCKVPHRRVTCYSAVHPCTALPYSRRSAVRTVHVHGVALRRTPCKTKPWLARTLCSDLRKHPAGYSPHQAHRCLGLLFPQPSPPPPT